MFGPFADFSTLIALGVVDRLKNIILSLFDSKITENDSLLDNSNIMFVF